MDNKEKLMESVQFIINNCKNNASCESCPLNLPFIDATYGKSSKCALNVSPMHWKMKEVKKLEKENNLKKRG